MRTSRDAVTASVTKRLVDSGGLILVDPDDRPRDAGGGGVATVAYLALMEIDPGYDHSAASSLSLVRPVLVGALVAIVAAPACLQDDGLIAGDDLR